MPNYIKENKVVVNSSNNVKTNKGDCNTINVSKELYLKIFELYITNKIEHVEINKTYYVKHLRYVEQYNVPIFYFFSMKLLKGKTKGYHRIKFNDKKHIHKINEELLKKVS